MFKLISSIFNTKSNKTQNEQTSLYEFLKKNELPDGSLSKEAYDLPDEEKGGVPYAPGALDGTMYYHTNLNIDEAALKRLCNLIVQGCKTGREQEMDEDAVQNIFSAMNEYKAVSLAVPLIQEIREKKPDAAKLINFCLRIITNSPKREPVKFCLALMALFSYEEVYDIYELFAKHDEFTRYALFPIRGIKEFGSVDEMIRLSKFVKGWGKIYMVNTIVSYDSTLNQETRDWLLLEGFKNGVMDQYLALSCASTGHLDEFLKRQTLSDKELTSIASLIIALLDEGPVSGISGLEKSTDILNNFIIHAKKAMSDKTVAEACTKAKEYIKKAGNKEEKG